MARAKEKRLNTIPCPLCGSTDSKLVRHATEFRLRRRTYRLSECLGCAHVFVDPPPSPVELEQYYAETVPKLREDFGSENVGARAAETTVEREKYELFSQLGLMERPGALLDVGFGSGGFLAGMATRGWRSAGVEFTDKIDQSFASQFDTFLGPDALDQVPAGRFDVATLWHVLEHLRDPIDSLRRVRRALKPDGKLLIAVPSFDSVSARVFGNYWYGLVPPWHLHQFRPRTLELAISQAGFSVEEIRGFGEQAMRMFWISSITEIINALPDRPYRPLEVAALRVLRKTATLASFRLSALEQRIGRPSAIVAVARKNALAESVLRAS
jgi:SAM-dependent methyltransferase